VFRSDENAIDLPSGDQFGPEIAARAPCEISQLVALEIQEPNVSDPDAARGDKGQMVPARRKGRLIVERRIVRQALEP
jgi:hypothetical protein